MVVSCGAGINSACNLFEENSTKEKTNSVYCILHSLINRIYALDNYFSWKNILAILGGGTKHEAKCMKRLFSEKYQIFQHGNG